jgi:hypothetical protein
MAECGFEKDLGNGLRVGILGLALGAIGWIIFGAVKGGHSYAGRDTRKQKLEEAREKRQESELRQRRAERNADKLRREQARTERAQERSQMRNIAKASQVTP